MIRSIPHWESNLDVRPLKILQFMGNLIHTHNIYCLFLTTWVHFEFKYMYKLYETLHLYMYVYIYIYNIVYRD